jgi:hypothetical protein
MKKILLYHLDLKDMNQHPDYFYKFLFSRIQTHVQGNESVKMLQHLQKNCKMRGQ